MFGISTFTQISESMISKKTFNFLKELRANNHRDWFQENKERYTQAHEEMIAFAERLNGLMSQHDQLVPMSGKKSLYRIYRDVRFSKDKTPYKSAFSGRLKRDTDWLRGGYFYKIGPGVSTVACGFWNPNPRDLKLIRDNIALDSEELRKVLSKKRFVQTFGQLEGQKVKTAPRGYDPEHKSIDLLRHKQFIVQKKFSDKEALSENFVDIVNNTFKEVRPFFNYMSEILTHDLNGLPLY